MEIAWNMEVNEIDVLDVSHDKLPKTKCKLRIQFDKKVRLVSV